MAQLSKNMPVRSRYFFLVCGPRDYQENPRRPFPLSNTKKIMNGRRP